MQAKYKMTNNDQDCYIETKFSPSLSKRDLGTYWRYLIDHSKIKTKQPVEKCQDSIDNKEQLVITD